jgi:hypothetical protein
MRGVHAVIVSLLALSGGMRATAPVAFAQPQSAMVHAPTTMAYAAAPMPAASESAASMRAVVPLGTALGPGDTVLVGERWF